MDEPSRAATMADVARAAGCHPSTVSLALRDDRRIAPETRLRVREAAEKLNYSINPLVAAWVSARRTGRPVERHVSTAYLTCHPASFRWRLSSHFSSIYEGAREQAERFGFVLTEFRLSDYSGKLERLNQVLVTRGVEGVIVGPTLEHHQLKGLEWSRFALVTIGYGLTVPALHRVTEDHYLGMKLAFEKCLEQKHRRIGLALLGQHNAVRRERWIGAYLFEQHQLLRPSERLPIFVASSGRSKAEVRKWLKKHKPSVVLADDPSDWSDLPVPTMGFALSTAHDFPGVHENNRGIGSHAADLLVGLVLRNERGIPKIRQTVLVEPSLDVPAG